MAPSIVTRESIASLIGVMTPFTSNTLTDFFDISYSGASAWMDRNVGVINEGYEVFGWTKRNRRYAMLVPHGTNITGRF